MCLIIIIIIIIIIIVVVVFLGRIRIVIEGKKEGWKEIRIQLRKEANKGDKREGNKRKRMEGRIE